MANLDIPSGLKPIKHLNGSSWSGKTNVYYIPSTDATPLYKGDAVKLAGSADTLGKFPTVAQAAAGDALVGVVAGFGDNPYIMIQADTPIRTYRPASTGLYVLVVDDPDVIFEAQEDSVGAALAATDVGDYVDLVVASGSVMNRGSYMEIDSSSKLSTTAQLRLLRVVDREDNALGDHCKWEVFIAEHTLRMNPSA